MQDIDFSIEISQFNEGLAPLAHLDSKTFLGNKGQASDMKADIISNPGFLQQSPALANLANGTQAGVVNELIRYILDTPVDTDVTLGVGTGKLFKISPTTVISSSLWPQTIANMVSGESIVRVKDNVFVLYNKSSGGDIALLPLTDFFLFASPQTAANDSDVGTDDWDNPNDALGQDDDRASFDTTGALTSHYLKLTNFGFAIPSGATIVGVVVDVEQLADDNGGHNVHSDTIKLVKAGTVGGDNIAQNDDWTSNESYITYGAKDSLAGNTLTPSDINNSGFGVAISVVGDGAIAQINNVRISVYYTTSDDASVISNWGSIIDQPLISAPHPSSSKEDIMLFGNGQYCGVFIQGQNILDTQKLDFGEDKEVVDVVFNANVWWIAVNSKSGRRSEVYLYDGSALSNILSDEAGVGAQKIGFLYVLNGIVYIAYQDLTADGYTIGWLSGRQLKPLHYFAGTLPDHRQKTLYKNTILFVAGSNILSAGASVEQLPIQVSILAAGGYATLGGIAAPFGTPMIASMDGGTNFRIAKFSGLSTDSIWKSISVDITKARMLGKINTVIVMTKPLEGDARADIKLEGNQGSLSSQAMEVSGVGKTRFVFTSIALAAVEDIRTIVDYLNGDDTDNCPIRKIVLLGNFVER